MRSKLCFLILSVALILTSCQDVTPPDTDTSADNVTETKPTPDTEEEDDGVPRRTVYRLLSREMREGERTVDSVRFGYDEKGRLTYVRESDSTEPHLTVTYGDGGEVYEITDSSRMKTVTRRFENGNQVFVGGYVGGTLIESREYAYDGGGRIISDIEYSETGAIKEKREYRYETDENGNVTAMYFVEADREILYETYEYIEDGNCTVTAGYYGDDAPNSYVHCDYDGNGNITSYVQYGVNEWEIYLVASVEYEYNGEGKITAEKIYVPNAETGETMLSQRVIYEYENGLLTSVSEFHGEKEYHNTVAAFEYDENGCLILYTFTHYNGDAVEYEESTAYTWREFSLTEEEIAANEINDAIIREVTDLYRPPDYYN